jgi:hypothetical protein
MSNFYHDFANGFDTSSENTEKILGEHLKIIDQKKKDNEDYIPDRYEEAVANIWTAEANRKWEIEGFRNYIDASVVPLLKESLSKDPGVITCIENISKANEMRQKIIDISSKSLGNFPLGNAPPPPRIPETLFYHDYK